VIKIPKKVLVFAAHQDDETIGCGGTIRKWADRGCRVEVCFMTDGSTGIKQGTDGSEIVETRNKEAIIAAKILGIQKIHNLGLPCQKVSNRKQNFHKVIKIIREVKPDLVITHNQVCKHRDHKRTSAIVEEACWKASENIMEELGGVHTVGAIWSFEILDPFDDPDYVVDITEQYGLKMEALKVYMSQLDILNEIERYLDGITKVRGYSIGEARGEAFKSLGRSPIKL